MNLFHSQTRTHKTRAPAFRSLVRGLYGVLQDTAPVSYSGVGLCMSNERVFVISASWFQYIYFIGSVWIVSIGQNRPLTPFFFLSGEWQAGELLWVSGELSRHSENYQLACANHQLFRTLDWRLLLLEYTRPWLHKAGCPAEENFFSVCRLYFALFFCLMYWGAALCSLFSMTLIIIDGYF